MANMMSLAFLWKLESLFVYFCIALQITGIQLQSCEVQDIGKNKTYARTLSIDQEPLSIDMFIPDNWDDEKAELTIEIKGSNTTLTLFPIDCQVEDGHHKFISLGWRHVEIGYTSNSLFIHCPNKTSKMKNLSNPPSNMDIGIQMQMEFYAFDCSEDTTHYLWNINENVERVTMPMQLIIRPNKVTMRSNEEFNSQMFVNDTLSFLCIEEDDSHTLHNNQYQTDKKCNLKPSINYTYQFDLPNSTIPTVIFLTSRGTYTISSETFSHEREIRTPDSLSTGAIVGIVLAVIIPVGGMIIFGIVFFSRDFWKKYELAI